MKIRLSLIAVMAAVAAMAIPLSSQAHDGERWDRHDHRREWRDHRHHWRHGHRDYRTVVIERPGPVYRYGVVNTYPVPVYRAYGEPGIVINLPPVVIPF